MSDEYLQDKKYILENIKEHKENIKELYKNDEAIKLTLQTLVVKMTIIVFIGGSFAGAIISVISKKVF